MVEVPKLPHSFRCSSHRLVLKNRDRAFTPGLGVRERDPVTLHLVPGDPFRFRPSGAGFQADPCNQVNVWIVAALA